MSRFISLLSVGPILLLTSLTAACSSDDPVTSSDVPYLDDAVGQYEATTLTLAGQDLLALGTSLTLTLGSDRSVSGRFVVPEAAGGPLDADMVGTFTFADGIVEITQTADTFVRDVDWVLESSRILTGEFNSSEGTVSVRLVGTPIS
jgi:hypothetical protein